jgi:hypothetical protein
VAKPPSKRNLEYLADLFTQYGKAAVDEVLSALGRDAEPEMVKKAVAQRAAEKPAKKAAPAAPTEKAAGKRIAGAPQNVTTARQEAAKRKKYKATVEKGVQGALWYDDSGKAIMSHVGEDPEMARKLGGNFAVTSASTGVKPNTGFAVKGHNQAMSGDPVVTGRFPTAMGAQIEEIYDAGGEASGLKRGPFEQQLAVGGGYADPSIDPRAVHDIWDGRAWGYTDADGTPFSGSFTDAQHRWQDEQLRKVIPTLSKQPFPWTTGRVQAAGWSGEKINAGEILPEEAAYSYADDLPRHYGQGSRETVFGSNTGIMPELLNADYAVKKELDDRVFDVLYDAQKRDRLGLGFGALTGPAFKGPGIYEGISPGTQAQYALGANTIKKGEETDDLPVGKVIDPSSLNLMKAIEASYGLLTGQKAIAGNRFFADAPAASRNAAQLNIGEPIDNERAQMLLDLQERLGVDPNSMAIVPSPSGVRLRDFGGDKELFKKYATDAAKAIGSGKPEGGFFHGMYEENPWETDAGRYGQSYLDLIGERPAYVQSFDKVAPPLAANLRDVYKQFAKENRMTIPGYFDDLLNAISGGGERELRELIRKRGYAEGGAVDADNLVTSLQSLLEKYQTV